MNSHQSSVVKIAVGVIFLTLLYPPYQIMGRSLGYGWVFSPPHDYAIIDQGQMMVQWMAIIIVAFVFSSVLKSYNVNEDGKTTVTEGDLSKVTSPFLIGALRIVRGIFGLIGATQLFGVLPALSWFSRDAFYQPEFMQGVALFFGKVVIACVCIGLFFFMRKWINMIHAKSARNSTALPLLSKWQL